MLSQVWTGSEDRALMGIALSVVAAHLVFLAMLTVQFAATPAKVVPARPLVVKTINLQPPIQTAASPASLAAKNALPEKTTTVKKKEPPPKKAPKASVPEKIAPSKESISKIQANLSKINTKSLENIPVVEVPNMLAALSVESLPDFNDAHLSEAEAHYKDELARRLKMFLTLPERGEVVIKLTLDRLGTVMKLSIESATNAANKKYVEKTLPGLAFPPFGTYFGGQTQHTFTVALRSESL